MPTDVMGTPLYVTASNFPVSGIVPTATPTISSRFDPFAVTVWLQLKLEPLNTEAPPALGPTASNDTPAGGSVVTTDKETVVVRFKLPLTPVTVRV